MMSIIKICALLMILWQSADCAGIYYPSIPVQSPVQGVVFSPRLLFSRKEGDNVFKGNAVTVAQGLIRELGLYELEGELLQAKYFPNGLLFEMSNALQAIQVVDAWNSKKNANTDKYMDNFVLQQTDLEFFKSPIDLRTAGPFITLTV